ncbi:sensor histidine kinase [Microbacterium sp. gxy059]|uniref:sensor histidine kinase n=1 Tax=Microbacterium sp. gxy059 TaxID=2957199 RepID=UPI003D99E1BB
MGTTGRAGERDPWERWGWLMAVVWMVFLAFPIISLLRSDASPFAVGIGWFGLVAFGAAYVAGFLRGMRGGWRRPVRSVLLLFLAAVLCAGLTVPAIGWQATSFLPFLMAYAAYGLARPWHWTVLSASVALVVAHAILAPARGEQPAWPLLGIVLMMAVVNTITTWLIDRSVAAEELRLDLATSRERESVARDVHDLVGHSLTVVKLKAELAARLVERDPAAARAELEEIARLTGEAISGVRSTVTGLRAEGLDAQLAAIRAAFESAGIDIEVVGDASALSTAQSLPAGWILREATTNILRHARARSVRIVLAPGTMTVEDDGTGLRGAPGNGLRGMAERAAAAGAVLDVAPLGGGDRGTKVSLTW